jgi:signal transduction histidine kinase
VVEEEVGTLRRLVGEFSSFARLPRADLSEGDLGDFLREQASRALFVREELEKTGSLPLDTDLADAASKVRVSWYIPSVPMPAHLDRQMLHQVIANILRNAVQALLAHRGEGRIEVGVSPEAQAYTITVDDDGPGVPEAMRESVFDPYVTTKSDGTGLGLAIVKKIVVEHGGTIDAGASPLGGARFRIRIPRPTSPEAQAVRAVPPSLVRSGVRQL